VPYEEIMEVYRERTCFNSTRPAMLRQELFEASIREYPYSCEAVYLLNGSKDRCSLWIGRWIDGHKNSGAFASRNDIAYDGCSHEPDCFVDTGTVYADPIDIFLIGRFETHRTTNSFNNFLGKSFAFVEVERKLADDARRYAKLSRCSCRHTPPRRVHQSVSICKLRWR